MALKVLKSDSLFIRSTNLSPCDRLDSVHLTNHQSNMHVAVELIAKIIHLIEKIFEPECSNSNSLALQSINGNKIQEVKQASSCFKNDYNLSWKAVEWKVP